MTVGEFAQEAAKLRRLYGGSVTSGGRTDAHERTLPGGIVGGPHGWDLAFDWIYSTGPNRLGSAFHPTSPFHCPICSTDKIKLLHELDHDHIQPQDFPAGPVTVYNGERKTWV